jgi:hypothetical protein
VQWRAVRGGKAAKEWERGRGVRGGSEGRDGGSDGEVGEKAGPKRRDNEGGEVRGESEVARWRARGRGRGRGV